MNLLIHDGFAALTPSNGTVAERDDPHETWALRFTGRESITIDFTTLLDTQLPMVKGQGCV